ncbi:peroxiredoxin [Labilibaculum filiforme]|uniref:Peroxiredoxin n=2 Tax=Labilibaculum filiforme TaxID=1940526 RepID=A0A2N3HUW8_9BACT|nr:peroxiredoxin [Labilibaculum filiforme]
MNSTQKENTESKAMLPTEIIKDGVFIHITEGYNDPHRVLMPLKMAVLMSEDKDVLVYMDIHATELLVKGAKDMGFSEFESYQAYLKQLIDKKVGIYACPTCLKVAGYEPNDLMDGIQLAEKDKFFSFTKGRILTFDY